MNKFNRLRVLRRTFSSVASTKKAIKNESAVYRSFFGELDKDFLKFPKFINAQSYDEKYERIRREFRDHCSDSRALESSGILPNTQEFSTFDLVRYFEAIGCSLNYQKPVNSAGKSPAISGDNSLIQIDDRLVITKGFLQEYNEKKSFTHAILPILIRDSLVLPTIAGKSLSSPSSTPSSESSESSRESTESSPPPKTGFAFCELNEKFTSLPHSFWSSTAVYDEKAEQWILSGRKNRILKDSRGDYKQFLVFCRLVHGEESPESTENASESLESVENPQESSESQDGLVAFLLSADEVEVQPDGSDNYGNEYLRIQFQNIPVDRPAVLLGADETLAMNAKAKGQLSVAGLVYGVCRQIFANAVRELSSGAPAPSTASSIPPPGAAHNNIAGIALLLHSLETCLYHTTAQFDAYDDATLDLYLQALVCKTLATETASLIIAQFRLLFPARVLSKVMSGETMNVLNVLDSFLESTVSNRLLLAAYGIKSVGQWRADHFVKLRLPMLHVKYNLKRLYLHREDDDQRMENAFDDRKALKKVVNGRLKDCATMLENVLKDCEEAAERIIKVDGKKSIEKQVDMNRLATMTMSAYQMMAVIGRTNDALNDHHSTSGSDGERNMSADDQLELCTLICFEHAGIVTRELKLIYGRLEMSEEYVSGITHTRNVRFGGYFPPSPFDRCV